MKKIFSVLPVVFFCIALQAQQPTTVKHRIALFAPLYLDSAFDATGTYRYGKNEFPDFISPGLEFYEGAQLALDSMRNDGKELEVYVYDTRSATQTLAQQLVRAERDSVELIIAHCSGTEVRPLAEFALRTNTPFINANLPNDLGVRGNPFFVLVNSTLRTQCEGIYAYMQRYYSAHPVVVFRRRGAMEDLLKTTFTDIAKETKGTPLKMRYVDLPDSFSVNTLKNYLDSTHTTLCMAGSMNETFGKRLAFQLASLNKTYPVAIMGMPTWDVFHEFSKPEYKDVEIMYSTPFYNPRTDSTSVSLVNFFNTVMYSRPSDMVFRGFEVMWKYANLLLQYGHDISSNLSSKQYTLFTEFDIEPVLNRDNLTLDYFENKKLYFIKWQGGVIKSVN